LLILKARILQKVTFTKKSLNLLV